MMKTTIFVQILRAISTFISILLLSVIQLWNGSTYKCGYQNYLRTAERKHIIAKEI